MTRALSKERRQVLDALGVTIVETRSGGKHRKLVLRKGDKTAVTSATPGNSTDVRGMLNFRRDMRRIFGDT